MVRLLRLGVWFGAPAVAAFLLASATTSEAFERRVSAFYCAPAQGSTVWFTGHRVYSQSSSSIAQLLCPVPSDTQLPHAAVTTMFAHGYDGNPTDVASVGCCVSSPSTTIGTCGNPSFTPVSFVGDFSYSCTLSGWTSNPSWYPYVNVGLPAVHGGVKSSLAGIYLSN
jgi:hypothetical protein